MQVLVVKEKETWDITEMVQSVDWFGKKYRAARTVKISFISLSEGQHQTVKQTEGEGIYFKWNGVELFRGVIFSTGRSKKGSFQITAYDQLAYLLKNYDSYVFKNITLTGITKRICSDFGIPTGSLIDTRYVIPNKVYDDVSLYDMILEGMQDTHKNSTERFYVRSDKGKIQLFRRVEQTSLWVIEDGVNLINYSYDTSIEDTANRVKLESGEGKKTLIATANNGTLQKRFGILQHYERTTEDLNQAQLQTRANKILKDKGKVKVDYSIEGLGIPEVISGGMVHIKEGELGINRMYYVDYDFHTFKGKDHLMSLELTLTDE